MHEGIDEESENESKYNLGENDLVIQLLQELISIGIKKRDIGVITPYNAQVNLIKKSIRQSEELHTKQDSAPAEGRIEVSTVDGF